jgi:ABC-type transport system involved in multi-copper enzyme maturation permease subunit
VTGFGALVRLYLRDLARRRFFWGLFVLTAGVIAVNYWTTRMMEEAVSQGESFDIATRQAASRLDSLMSFLRPWVGFVVVLLAAQLAPEARRNGTTQFVLSLGVRRNVLALAQFVALAIVLTAALVVLHAGFSIAGVKTASLGAAEIGLSWATLLLPALAIAAAVFSFSLTASALETYLLFLGVPFIARVLPNALGGFPRGTPLLLVRFVENLRLLFPEFDELVLWPHLSFGRPSPPPLPQWHWPLIHLLVATAFWTALGVWLQRRHDFGSRTALK